MWKKTVLWLGPLLLVVAWIVDLAVGHRDVWLAFAAGMCVMWLGLRWRKRLNN